MKKAATLRDAVGQALEAQGGQAKVAILPGLGNITLPKLAPAAERVLTWASDGPAAFWMRWMRRCPGTGMMREWP